MYVRFLLNMVNQGPEQNLIISPTVERKQKSMTFLSAGPRNFHLTDYFSEMILLFLKNNV